MMEIRGVLARPALGVREELREEQYDLSETNAIGRYNADIERIDWKPENQPVEHIGGATSYLHEDENYRLLLRSVIYFDPKQRRLRWEIWNIGGGYTVFRGLNYIVLGLESKPTATDIRNMRTNHIFGLYFDMYGPSEFYLIPRDGTRGLSL